MHRAAAAAACAATLAAAAEAHRLLPATDFQNLRSLSLET
jgi:hypothetical protein